MIPYKGLDPSRLSREKLPSAVRRDFPDDKYAVHFQNTVPSVWPHSGRKFPRGILEAQVKLLLFRVGGRTLPPLDAFNGFVSD